MTSNKRDLSPKSLNYNRPHTKSYQYSRKRRHKKHHHRHRSRYNTQRFIRNELPIDACKTDILQLIASTNIAIITGETGSGKSTQLAQILYNNNYNNIIITQPRRVSAVSLARRVSKEMNEKLGDLVGFTIRFEDCSNPSTHIRYVTDGILLRELIHIHNNSSSILKYDVIILDEAHERSLQTDILFAILKQSINDSHSISGKSKLKSNVKLLITSATLNIEKFSTYFNDCPVYHIKGRCFPVEVHHCLQSVNDYISASVDCCLNIHQNEEIQHNSGHILCFLTGFLEIQRACKLLNSRLEKLEIANVSMPDIVILPLYSSLTYNEQQLIFAKVPKNCRKVIFATNIAETALTVDGISFVVDGGLVKQKSFNSSKSMDILSVVQISKTSAVQRKGRAGRTTNGKCFRLYTKMEFDGFMDETVPEIQRINLCSSILILKSMKIGNILAFDFLDAPNINSIKEALVKLYLFGAIDGESDINEEIGSIMIEFPLHPMFSKILIEAVHYGCSDAALSVIAVASAGGSSTSVNKLFLQPPKSEIDLQMKEKYYLAHKKFDSKYGDIVSWLLVVSDFMQFRNEIQKELKQMENDRRRKRKRKKRDRSRSRSRSWNKDENENESDFGGKHLRQHLVEWCKLNFLNFGILFQSLKIRQQLKDILYKIYSKDEIENNQSLTPIKSLRKTLAKSLFMQYAHRLPQSQRNGKYERIVFKDCRGDHIYVHPSCEPLISNSKVQWVVYIDIIETSKAFMRGICWIEYAWIKRLLPKVGNVNVGKLCGFESERKENGLGLDSECVDGNQRMDSSSLTLENEVDSKAVCLTNNNVNKMERKSTFDEVKERYLKRKHLKKQLQSLI